MRHSASDGYFEEINENGRQEFASAHSGLDRHTFWSWGAVTRLCFPDALSEVIATAVPRQRRTNGSGEEETPGLRQGVEFPMSTGS